jgi:hypothetical protein
MSSGLAFEEDYAKPSDATKMLFLEKSAGRFALDHPLKDKPGDVFYYSSGTTNILQGLYWAWEVLMPGEPFNQGLVTTPFTRDRYIILVTDGAQVGGNGDAYKGRFGAGEIAGENTNSAHGMITAPNDAGVVGSRNNNLDNRLRALARNVKDEGIKLFVIGFNLANNPDELAMLEGIASPTENGVRYFYSANTAADLADAFEEIASRLTDVRLSM